MRLGRLAWTVLAATGLALASVSVADLTPQAVAQSTSQPVEAAAPATVPSPGPQIPAYRSAPVPQEIPVALLVDLQSGQTLFAREADRRFVPASVTKVMTAYTAFRLIAQGEVSPTMPFLYPQRLEDEWYAEGSNMFLRAGERPTIGQLLLGVTTVSGNDASVALAEASVGSLEAWLELMNRNAEELGMADTHFGSANGYPDGGRTYTSARDLVLLARAMTQDHPGLYRRYFGHRSLRWRDIAQANHDPVTGRVEGADGLKTGYTREAGFTFLGSAERDGRRLVMIIAGSPDRRMRDTASRDLLEWGFANFRTVRLAPASATVGEAEIQNGSAGSVPLRLVEPLVLAIPRGGSAQDWHAEIVYRGPIQAPVEAGQPIARLRLFVSGHEALEVPLLAGQSVEQAGPLRRVANALTGLFT